MFSGLDVHGTDPAEYLITAGWNVDDVDRDLPDLYMVSIVIFCDL